MSTPKCCCTRPKTS
ncbi:unnamed protein product [Oikopleura dioica]|uniref:Uncharacterized protein n=1 Tax=Oikopleura dioica TaxID=34765 RepID=E4YNX7_OIKDI|nr:unnamed protein product [Oikopleura dioica]